jgi:hypothetical protein
LTTISITLQDETARKLEIEATRRKLTVEELLARSAEELIETHAEKVRRISREVIQEEADLLRRLA